MTLLRNLMGITFEMPLVLFFFSSCLCFSFELKRHGLTSHIYASSSLFFQFSWVLC